MLQRFIRTCLASSFFLSLSFTECYFRCAFHLKILEWILYRNRGNLFKFTAGHPGRVLWSFGLLSLPSEQVFSALVLLRSCECPLKQHLSHWRSWKVQCAPHLWFSAFCRGSPSSVLLGSGLSVNPAALPVHCTMLGSCWGREQAWRLIFVMFANASLH